MKILCKMCMTILNFAALLGIFILGLLIFTAKANAELTAKANHDHIKIDFFYHGSTVSVKGTSEPGTELIIKIASDDSHEALKQKGKVGGFLWMNTGTLNIEHVPNFYSIHSTKKTEDILDHEEALKYIIGYPALEEHVEITPVSNESDRDAWFKEFIRFKESSNLYATSEGKITTSLEDGRQSYYILTNWPYQAPPGNYLATVYAVKNGKVIETAESKVKVEQVGIVSLLAGMAKNKAALYGIISILAALLAGFGVGLVFRKGGGAH